jgi:hypothetical protein
LSATLTWDFFLFARETSGAETSAEGDHKALYSSSTWHKKTDALSMKTSKRKPGERVSVDNGVAGACGSYSLRPTLVLDEKASREA